jgi:hypothetical protein
VPRADSSRLDEIPTRLPSDRTEYVEFTLELPGMIPIRDSKNPTGPALILSRSAFTGLVDDAKADSTVR